jgi:hypothetical protein
MAFCCQALDIAPNLRARAEEMSEARSAVADDSARPIHDLRHAIVGTPIFRARSTALISGAFRSSTKRSPGWIAVTAIAMLLVRVNNIDSAQSGRTLLLGRWIPPHTDSLKTLPA